MGNQRRDFRYLYSNLDAIIRSSKQLVLEFFDFSIHAANVCCHGNFSYYYKADFEGYGVYFFFASFMLISIPYVFFLVPETKGIPLEDINSLFRKGLRPWKAHPVVLAEIRQRHEAFFGDEEG